VIGTALKVAGDAAQLGTQLVRGVLSRLFGR